MQLMIATMRIILCQAREGKTRPGPVRIEILRQPPVAQILAQLIFEPDPGKSTGI